MKKIKFLVLIVVFSLMFQSTYWYDQEFASIKLRFGKSYIFTDTFNSEWYLSYIRGATTRFAPESVKPIFYFSDEISNRTPESYSWYVEATWPDSSLEILKSDNFVINYLPAEWRQNNNIEIVYDISYQNKINGVRSEIKSHTEYQPYEITWCWDGIVDNYVDPVWWEVTEICDDWNNIDWDGCSATCENEEEPQVCEAWVTWIQTLPISEITPDLCTNTWETVTNFAETIIWTLSSYTWDCTDWVETYTGWNCSASYDITTVEDVCEAWVTWTQIAPISENTPNLCLNSDETVENFSSSTSWITTSYTWACTTWEVINIGGNCSASYTSSWGNSGWSAICLDIISEWVDKYTCTWNHRTTNFGIDCDWDGIYEQVSWEYDIVNWVRTHEFTCENPDSISLTPRCAVEKHYIAVDQSSGWNTSSACYNVAYCWNGKIESGEECERSINEDGTLWEWPSFCIAAPAVNECTIKHSWGWWGWITTTPLEDWNLTTIPSEWEIGFSLNTERIIWYYQNVFKSGYIKPYMENNSNYTLDIDAICLLKYSWNHISWVGSPICTNINSKFYPWTKVELIHDLSSVKWNKLTSDYNDGEDYYDNDLVLTIKIGSEYYSWSEILRDTWSVRVAKPAIQSTSGTSNNKVGSNTNNVSNWIFDSEKNNNDVWVWAKSSSSKISDNSLIDLEADDYNDNALLWTTTETEFVRYNGLDNVFIIKGDVNMSNIEFEGTKYSDIPKATTYIIDWNLTIDEDVYSWFNMAFIVKNWWNIIVNSNVTEIKWTYIVLWTWIIEGEVSSETLIVNWSLYWNSKNLVSNRYNVEEVNWKLTFGTIVSFWSSIFQKPAPLITSFINDYLETSKVAK